MMKGYSSIFASKQVALLLLRRVAGHGGFIDEGGRLRHAEQDMIDHMEQPPDFPVLHASRAPAIDGA